MLKFMFNACNQAIVRDFDGIPCLIIVRLYDCGESVPGEPRHISHLCYDPYRLFAGQPVGYGM